MISYFKQRIINLKARLHLCSYKSQLLRSRQCIVVPSVSRCWSDGWDKTRNLQGRTIDGLGLKKEETRDVLFLYFATFREEKLEGSGRLPLLYSNCQHTWCTDVRTNTGIPLHRVLDREKVKTIFYVSNCRLWY